MQEIERLFRNLFSDIINRFKYNAMEAAERKVRDTINQQLERQKPKRQDQDNRE